MPDVASLLAAAVLAAAQTEGLVHVLLVVVLAAIGCVGIGATALVLRIILPGVAASADGALARMGTRRLLLSGIVPLIGAGLLARGVELAGSEALGVAYLLVVVLPLCLAWLAGLLAGLPHIGGQVLRTGSEPSPLARATVGGLVTGLTMVSWVLPPLGLFVSVLLTSWFVGAGIGAALTRRDRPAAPVDASGDAA